MKTIILNFTFLLFGATLLAQNTWTVDNRPGTTAQFSSVQAAIDAASEGDFIYIHPSPTSYGSIIINKLLHIRGIGHGPELGNGERALLSNITLSRNQPITTSSGSSISGLEIFALNHINNSANDVFSNVTIKNNRINAISFHRIFNFIIEGNVFINTGSVDSNSFTIFDNTNHLNTVITHNIFIRNTNTQIGGVVTGLNATDTFNNNMMVFNNSSSGKIPFKSCNNPIVNNNIFLISALDNSTTAITTLNDVNNVPVNYQNCLTFAYGGQTLTALNGTNNLNNINPQFVDIGTPENPNFSYTKNYKLSVGSPAIDAGSDNDDLGIYGQGFLFQMKGYPFDLPYPTNININNAVVEAGGNLEVIFKANANVEN